MWKIFLKANKSTEINCKDREKSITFNNLSPDEKLQNYNCEELRCIADSRRNPKRNKIFKNSKQ